MPDDSARASALFILHLEDDDATARLFRFAVSEVNAEAKLFRVRTVERAVAFLYQDGEFNGAPRPNVVVLDVNLPGHSGFEVLTAIRNNPTLGIFPVVMFSSSSAPADRARASDLGAKEYLVKSSEWVGFIAAAQTAVRLAV